MLHSPQGAALSARQPIEGCLPMQGNLVAERPHMDDPAKRESGFIPPGSLLGSAAYLSSTRSRASVRAAETCQIAGFGSQELETLLVGPLS